MTRFTATLIAGLLLSAVGSAQPDKRLDEVLAKIEARMKATKSLHIEECLRIDKDRTTSKTWSGELRFLKPNLFAIRLEQQENKNLVEMMISTGKYLYEYRPQFKKLVVHELPGGDALNNNLVSLILGTSAAEAKRNFEMKITKDVSEKNPDLIYIELKPKTVEGKREFSEAQLVVSESTMLPRRLWFVQPNGNTVEWRPLKYSTKRELEVTDFVPGPLPEGWEKQEIPLPKDPPRRPGP